MLKRWSTLSTLFLGLSSSLCAAAASSASFENTAIVRTVELGGSLVHVTTTYAVKALEVNVKTYTIALGKEERDRTSWVEAKVKGQQKALGWSDRGYDPVAQVHFIDVELASPLALNASVNLVLDTVQTHATYAWPEQAAQTEEQKLKYETKLFVVSPYRTVVQRTKIRSPSPKVVSYTTPEPNKFTSENGAVSKSGATMTYGPFNNLPKSANSEFISEHQRPVVIHYHYEYPVVEVVSLKRNAEISHWGANLNIEDNIHLKNAGPLLKGHFSRLAHQTASYFKRIPPHVIPGLTLHLPPGISNTYYYDTIGNVSTSHLRTAPTIPSKKTRAGTGQYSVLELKPRYPLMGGWNYTFTLGWDAPLANSVGYDSSSGKYVAEIPVMTFIPGAVVDDAEVKIVLPEGATDVEFAPSFPALEQSLSTHVTYLDTVGRPALTLHYKQLTDKHAGGLIYVSYKVSVSAHLRKPFGVMVGFLALFAVSLVAKRVDLTLHKTKLL